MEAERGRWRLMLNGALTARSAHLLLIAQGKIVS
jgi:hypothetical protein